MIIFMIYEPLGMAKLWDTTKTKIIGLINNKKIINEPKNKTNFSFNIRDRYWFNGEKIILLLVK